MTKTFREEIYNTLVYTSNAYDVEKEDWEETTNKILKVFEKRIDEHIKKTWLVDKKAEILLRLELEDIKREMLK